MKLKQFFCWHNWGEPTNIREDDWPILALAIPLLLIIYLFDPPYVCDRKCSKCGKVKEFKYDRNSR